MRSLFSVFFFSSKNNQACTEVAIWVISIGNSRCRRRLSVKLNENKTFHRYVKNTDEAFDVEEGANARDYSAYETDDMTRRRNLTDIEQCSFIVVIRTTMIVAATTQLRHVARGTEAAAHKFSLPPQKKKI